MSHNEKDSTGLRRFAPHGLERTEQLSGVELAPFSRRAGAFAVDFILVLVTYIPVEIGRQFWLDRMRGGDGNLHVNFDFHELGNVVWLVLYFGLFVWKMNGKTPGKWLMRIRVLSLAAERITLWQSVERALGYGASVLEFGTGFLQYFTNRNHCCVHDRIAETIVVVDRKAADNTKR